MNIQVTNR